MFIISYMCNIYIKTNNLVFIFSSFWCVYIYIYIIYIYVCIYIYIYIIHIIYIYIYICNIHFKSTATWIFCSCWDLKTKQVTLFASKIL